VLYRPRFAHGHGWHTVPAVAPAPGTVSGGREADHRLAGAACPGAPGAAPAPRLPGSPAPGPRRPAAPARRRCVLLRVAASEIPVVPEPRRRLSRRRRAETRELLLVAGSLVADRTVTRSDDDLLAEWLSHVRLDDVLQVAKQLQLYLADHEPDAELRTGSARAAWARERRHEILAVDASGHRDIAKSTAYTVFDHERDFREQLARALLASERVNDPDGMNVAFDQRVADRTLPPRIETVAADLAMREFDRLRDLEAVYIELGAVPFAGHPLLRELLAATLAQAADRTDPRSLAAFYERALEAYGWELRDGLTTADLVVALYSLIQGYLFINRLWPDGVRDEVDWREEDRIRSAYAIATVGILRQFAGPKAGGPPGAGPPS
jgi:hypothetical protein